MLFLEQKRQKESKEQKFFQNACYMCFTKQIDFQSHRILTQMDNNANTHFFKYFYNSNFGISVIYSILTRF
ncbi:MAG: hypothetical protein RLZZ628_4028 [Bacteroidota bacterium]|jgi:hypothetical protein